jgi:LPXTG-motif cell wall-anchored protein
MKRATLIATAVLLAVVAVLSTRVLAQNANTQDLTYLTFSNTVEMPGVTLPAGTYTFRLADTPSRNVVQVLDRDQKNVMGQWLFVQAQRPQATDDTVIMFKENREGATPAVQYWYYPGETIGKEFIYPKDQAEKIAARTGQKVRSEEGYVAANAPPANSSADNVVQGPGLPAEADTTVKNAPAPAQPTASAGSLAGNRGVAPEPSYQIARQDTDRSVSTSERSVGTSGQLPKTGSEVPLFGLIGLLSLAGALGTRAIAARG